MSGRIALGGTPASCATSVRLANVVAEKIVKQAKSGPQALKREQILGDFSGTSETRALPKTIRELDFLRNF
jgi:hypothetical protein